DGIGDFHVTGVQTCALPISVVTVVMLAPEPGELRGADEDVPEQVEDRAVHLEEQAAAGEAADEDDQQQDTEAVLVQPLEIGEPRSEERRVGEDDSRGVGSVN